MLVRLDIWEKGNISVVQLSEKLRGALRHALCDAIMEFLVLPAPLCLEAACPLSAAELDDLSSAGESLATMATLSGCLACRSWAVLGGILLAGQGGRKLLSPLQSVWCLREEAS